VSDMLNDSSKAINPNNNSQAVEEKTFAVLDQLGLLRSKFRSPDSETPSDAEVVGVVLGILAELGIIHPSSDYLKTTPDDSLRATVLFALEKAGLVKGHAR
jgi:hypothetical protein